jgi:hypothetical protein
MQPPTTKKRPASLITLPGQGDGILQRMQAANKNNGLFEELEHRYGCGFAQWMLDELKKQQQ